MSKDTGGPAFPAIETMDYPSFTATTHLPGMTLRDFFAAKAMQAIVSTVPHLMSVQSCDVASEAYEFADAMLLERAK